MVALMMMTVSVSAKDNSDNDNDSESDVIKVVYPLDFADVKRVHFMLNTLNNVIKVYQKNFTEFDFSIVFYGPGLQYAMKDFNGTAYKEMPYIKHGGPTGKGTLGRMRALKQLAGDSLHFYVCGNTMKMKKVKKEQMFSFSEVTPTGIIKVIDLVRDGAVMIKIQ